MMHRIYQHHAALGWAAFMGLVAQADILLAGIRPRVADGAASALTTALSANRVAKSIGIRRRFSSRLLTHSNEAELELQFRRA
jgi:hypothetical protein